MDKKIYTDSFLNREIVLSPSIYDVFLTINQLAYRNILMLRPKDEFQLIPTDYTFEDPDTKAEASVRPTLDIDSIEISYSDIAERDPDLEYDFKSDAHNAIRANLLKDFVEDPFREGRSERLDTAFMAWKNKDIEPEPQEEASNQPSIWTNILRLLNSDVVWLGVAIGMVLASILFYFQGMQPLILSNYVDQTQKQMVELSKRYNSQIQPFISVQQNVLNNFSYNPDQLCSQTPVYANQGVDAQNIRRMELTALPDKDFNKEIRYRVFTQEDINSTYQSLYQEYSASLDKYKSPIANLSALPEYLVYRNQWIQACRVILQEKKASPGVTAACTQLSNQTKTYSQGQPYFWNDIKFSVEKGVNSCNKASKDYAKFQLEWFASYDRVMSYKPDFTEINSQLTNVNSQFTQKVKDSVTRIREVYVTKTQFTNIWYLLKIKI